MSQWYSPLNQASSQSACRIRTCACTHYVRFPDYCSSLPSLVHCWFSGMNNPSAICFPSSLVMVVIRLTTSTRPAAMAETSAIVSTTNPVMDRPLRRTPPTMATIIFHPPFFHPPTLSLPSSPTDLVKHSPPDMFTHFTHLPDLPLQSPLTLAQVSQPGSPSIKQPPSSEPSAPSKPHVHHPVSRTGRAVLSG